MTTLKWIPVSSIVGSVLQPRLQEDRGLDSLTDSILNCGMDTPVIVLKPKSKAKSKTPTTLYLMRSGHRRKAALLKLAKRGITALPPDLPPHRQRTAPNPGRHPRQRLRPGSRPRRPDRQPRARAPHSLRTSLRAQEARRRAQDRPRRHRPARRHQPKNGINRKTVDYLIAALDPKNLTLSMIQSWKQCRLDLGHVRVLYRLRRHKKRQKQLYTKILKENLSVTQARFWCSQLVDKGDIPLVRRANKLIADRLLKIAALKKLIDNKQLSVRPSEYGDQVTIKVDGPAAMREACLAVAAALKGLKL